MVLKAAASEADAVCLDLEDSIPADDKETARQNAARALTELDFGSRVRMVRVNGLQTDLTYRDVVEVVERAGAKLDLIMLPKAGCAADVAFLATLLDQIESRMRLTNSIGIEAQIESAAGFVNIHGIAAASRRLEALIFGSGDYAASMGMPASGIGTFDAEDELYPGHRWHAVMHAIVAAARANNLRCMDGPYSAHTDESGFERACRIARSMGFDGKQCIHPGQLSTANTIFSPAAAEIDHANAIVAAYERGVVEGRGAVSLDGRMIDEANIRMARMVLARQRRIAERGT
jgi:citrate lyase subunit beta/citryl-CoA lyase